MRDFLDDAHEHRHDGYGRAQASEKRPLPKRFYKQTSVVPVDGGFAVHLDGRAIKTPGLKPVVVPVAAIGSAIAEEFAAQVEFIDPTTMPVLRLINSGLEGGEEKVPELRAEIVKFAGNDLLLYRADYPTDLVALQEQLWDGALVRIARHFGVSFRPTIGIVHQPQPQVTLDKLNAALEGEGLLVLTGLMAVTSITGSGLLALAWWHKLLDAEEVWLAAHVDEDHNTRLWGEVAEATARREQRRGEFDAAVRVLEMLRP